MKQTRHRPKVAGRRWTLALGLAVGTGLAVALLGARPVSGHEEAEAALDADPAVHLHPPVGIRSVGDVFPSR